VSALRVCVDNPNFVGDGAHHVLAQPGALRTEGVVSARACFLDLLRWWSCCGSGSGWLVVGLGSQPDEDVSDADGGPVAVAELVITGSHGPELLAAVHQPFDPVALPVAGLVERWRPAATAAPPGPVSLLVGRLGYRVGDLPAAQRGPVSPRTVCLVRAEEGQPLAGPTDPARAGYRHRVQQGYQLSGVGVLAWGDPAGQVPAPSLTDRVDLRGEPAARAAQTLPARRFRRGAPPFCAPAACWWARTTEVSAWPCQSRSPAASALVCRCASMRTQVPSSCQRANRWYSVSHGPYRSGTSRHGTPVRTRNRIPLITCRCSRHRPPRCGVRSGNNGSITAYSASVSSKRPGTPPAYPDRDPENRP
jgi:hypothetical protein